MCVCGGACVGVRVCLCGCSSACVCVVVNVVLLGGRQYHHRPAKCAEPSK